MGGYDTRDPAPVALQITRQLRDRWQAQPPAKPVILVTQGDPREERGIAAITRHVAEELGIPRAMAFLDPSIADYHKPNADQHGVILEIPYSLLASELEKARPGVMIALEQAVEVSLAEKNVQRQREGKAALQSYYRDFALLQEVTKAACQCICGELTVAHTSGQVSPFSVTSFYQVGLDLALISPHQIMALQEP